MIGSKTLSCGFTLPVLGLGTWGMGGYMKRDPASNDAGDIAALRTGLDLGFRHIDTAEIYGGGGAEEITGAAIAGWKRSDLFITSKVWTNHLTCDGVREAAEGSLHRLGTDYLDLYLIHHVREDIPLKETIRGLDRLRDEGLIRNIGVSNFAVRRCKEAQTLSHYKIVANQVHYNLVVREPELELLQYCLDNDVLLIAWRPVQAAGILQNPGELIRQLAAKYRRTPAQIAINWLIAQKNVVTVAAMRSQKHIPENLAACDFTMAKAEIDLLRRDFPGQLMASDALPLK